MVMTMDDDDWQLSGLVCGLIKLLGGLFRFLLQLGFRLHGISLNLLGFSFDLLALIASDGADSGLDLALSLFGCGVDVV